MSYETRRMALKLHDRRMSLGLSAALAAAPAGDPLSRALAARRPEPAPRAPSAPSTQPAPKPAGKAWAHAFYQAAQSSNLPLATLNAIVTVCDSQDEAMRRLNARINTPSTSAAQSAADGDAAVRRLLAAHAKAHQPIARTKRR